MFTLEFEKKAMRWAKKRELDSRFAHTQRVVDTVTELAEHWAPDAVRVCRIAAWIHDGQKHKTDEKLLAYALKHGEPIREAERENPMLLHGLVAYLKASKKLGFEDPQIRTACAYHTTGHPDMNLIDKLVFLADLIEPGRNFPSVNTLRELAWQDIDQAMLFSIDNTLRYLLAERRTIDPIVVALYNHLLAQVPLSD